MQLTEIVPALNRLAPLSLAAAWDNVGLLVEPSSPQPPVQRMLLTNDFTSSVWQEAERKNVGMIYCYHPVIFSPIKSLTCSSVKQSLLIRAVEKRVAIYCPHTAMDAVYGGVNDWLVNGLGSGLTMPIQRTEGSEREGFGRQKVFDTPVASLDEMISIVKSHLKVPRVWVARSAKSNAIRSVAVCAGSGAEVLRSAKADVFVTGEMSHHNVLEAVQQGTHVIICGHSNTERGFLHELRPKIERALNGKVEVSVSEVDADPLGVE